MDGYSLFYFCNLLSPSRVVKYQIEENNKQFCTIFCYSQTSNQSNILDCTAFQRFYFFFLKIYKPVVFGQLNSLIFLLLLDFLLIVTTIIRKKNPPNTHQRPKFSPGTGWDRGSRIGYGSLVTIFITIATPPR